MHGEEFRVLLAVIARSLIFSSLMIVITTVISAIASTDVHVGEHEIESPYVKRIEEIASRAERGLTPEEAKHFDELLAQQRAWYERNALNVGRRIGSVEPAGWRQYFRAMRMPVVGVIAVIWTAGLIAFYLWNRRRLEWQHVGLVLTLPAILAALRMLPTSEVVVLAALFSGLALILAQGKSTA